MPYSFQPSYHEAKKIARLEPKTYEALGGKLDDEYFTKLLALANMDWDTMIKTQKPSIFPDDTIPNGFSLRYDFVNLCKYNCRLEYYFRIFVTTQDNEVIRRSVTLNVRWHSRRYALDGIGGAAGTITFGEIIGSCSTGFGGCTDLFENEIKKANLKNKTDSK